MTDLIDIDFIKLAERINELRSSIRKICRTGAIKDILIKSGIEERDHAIAAQILLDLKGVINDEIIRRRLIEFTVIIDFQQIVNSINVAQAIDKMVGIHRVYDDYTFEELKYENNLLSKRLYMNKNENSTHRYTPNSPNV